MPSLYQNKGSLFENFKAVFLPIFSLCRFYVYNKIKLQGLLENKQALFPKHAFTTFSYNVQLHSIFKNHHCSAQSWKTSW